MTTFSQAGFEQERRQKLADALQLQANSQPVTNHLQGVSKVLASALGGYQERKAGEAGEQRKNLQQETLRQALDPSTDRTKLPQILAQGGYEDAALRMTTEKQQADPFTLSPGDVRYDGNGKEIAVGPAAQVKPLSGVAQLTQDFRNGQIDRATYEAALKKATAQDGLSIESDGKGGFRLAQGAGVTGGFKTTEAQGQAASRARLISGGLRTMSEKLLSPSVDPLRMATADTVGALGPIGGVLANKIRTPNEQGLSAAKDAALEGFASAVTGAGVTNDQFQRFSNILPSGSEDPAVQKQKLASAYEFLLTQTQIAGPIVRDIQEEIMRIKAGPETTPAAAPGIEGFERTKTINGINYGKRNGRWIVIR